MTGCPNLLLSFFLIQDFSTDKPMSWSHFNAEGDVEFKAVIYIPPKAPYDLFENYYSQKAFLKLYVRRVFISDEFDELLPKYLSFLRVSTMQNIQNLIAHSVALRVHLLEIPFHCFNYLQRIVVLIQRIFF